MLTAPPTRKTSQVNNIPQLLLGLAVVVVIIAVACGAIYHIRHTAKRASSTPDPAQATTSNTETKSETANKTPSKTKKTKTKSEITNKYDKQILKELRKAEKVLENGQVDEALTKFENLIDRYPKSPRARYGLAQAYDRQSEIKQSNQLLQRCIEAYAAVPEVPDCPVQLKRQALMRMADRLSFFGRSKAAADALERLHRITPADTKVLCELGVQYLLSGRNKEAKDVFRKVHFRLL